MMTRRFIGPPPPAVGACVLDGTAEDRLVRVLLLVAQVAIEAHRQVANEQLAYRGDLDGVVADLVVA